MSPLLLTAVLALAPDITVLTDARIRTLDDARPQARAMAWDAGGRILALGDGDELLARYPDAARIDAHGGTVIPGLIDAHAHLLGLAQALTGADLVGADSKTEVIARLQKHAQRLRLGEWLRGRGWDQNRWPDKRFPSAADLDAAFPERPVWLERIDGHAGWANSAALRALDRDLDGDWQPPGGEIIRSAGKATGIFIDSATALLDAIAPPPSASTRLAALREALAIAARNGLTGVHDMGTSLDDLALYRKLADAGELSLRVTTYADGDHAALAALCAMGAYRHPSGRLAMRGVKLYADGALGSRGAALRADYHDQAGHRGLLVTDPADLEQAMRKAHACGLQVATHAIGDRGNRLVLDLYAKVLGADAASEHRWRIEHAQVVALEDIPRFATLHALASMQPTHATSDMPWAGDRLGAARLAGAYAWRRFLDAGVRVPLGSDFPVEQVDPRLGLYAAITRQDLAGQPPGGWLPDQRLGAEEALAGFTREAAFAGFAENEVGRLAPGLAADFVLLAADPIGIDPRRIPQLPVLGTWLDGVAVYRAPGAPQ